MRVSNIASAKSHFSRLIERVKQGETILITDRNKPVATLQPISSGTLAGLEALHAIGLLSPPSKELDLSSFLSARRPALRAEVSLTSAVIAEREESR